MKFIKTFEAIQWNGDNFKEIKNMCGDYVCMAFGELHIIDYKDTTRMKPINISDYIIKTGNIIDNCGENVFNLLLDKGDN